MVPVHTEPGLNKQWPTKPLTGFENTTMLTSTSQSALLLVAEVADWRPVVLRKTYCFFLWSSQVRNFSCSAWNNRTTSPYKCQTYKEINTCYMFCSCFVDNFMSCHWGKSLPTPFSIVSLLSLHFMNRTTFQLVLQLTELTWVSTNQRKDLTSS